MSKSSSQSLVLKLDQAVEQRKAVSSLNFFARLTTNPKMLFTTLQCQLLKKTGLVRKVRSKTFWGQDITVNLPEVVSSEIMRFGYLEEAVARAFIQNVKPRDTVIDIGGHIGFFSSLAAELVGAKGQVHTFEPIPTTFSCLAHNCSGTNLQLSNAAAWNENTEIELNDYGLSYSAFNSVRTARLPGRATPKSSRVKVRAERIDDYCKRLELQPSFIKIDAESAEKEVLEGMQTIMTKIRPIICLEVGDLGVSNAASSRHLIDILMSYRYEPYEFIDGRFKSHEAKSDYGYSNLLFKPL